MKPTSRPKSTGKLILAVLAAAGGVIFLAIGIPGLLGATSDLSLAEGKGSVVTASSDVRRKLITNNSDRSSETNVISVEYTYRVDGRDYLSTTRQTPRGRCSPVVRWPRLWSSRRSVASSCWEAWASSS